MDVNHNNGFGTVETIRIKSDNPAHGGFIEINKSDFDPKTHKEFKGEAEAPAPAPAPAAAPAAGAAAPAAGGFAPAAPAAGAAGA